MDKLTIIFNFILDLLTLGANYYRRKNKEKKNEKKKDEQRKK